MLSVAVVVQVPFGSCVVMITAAVVLVVLVVEANNDEAVVGGVDAPGPLK